MSVKRYVVVGWLWMLLSGLAGCATPLPDHDMPPSYALEAPHHGLLHNYVRSQPAGSDSMSGFYLLDRGVDALSARLQLIETAQVSLDLQYYIYSQDVTGGLIAESVLAAADRGVRVRILLDDLGNALPDATLATLDRHTHIDVRLFNPVHIRHRWFRLPGKIIEFGRINHRMHNKLMIVDSLAMITGGRNIGDEYYALSETEFRDVDLLGIGPISREAVSSFDAFWNSPAAIPASVVFADANQSALNLARDQLRLFRKREARSDYIKAMEASAFTQALSGGRLALYWGESEWLADPPGKAVTDSVKNEKPYLARILADHVRGVRTELLMKSAYFIPGDGGVELLKGMVSKGATVSILTNSLATTDVLAVHSSYAPYRAPLLRGGVGLWELRPRSAPQADPSTFIGDSEASLHAKTFVFDGSKLFVGSINSDPRSIELNTEAGVMVYQTALAQRMRALFQRWTSEDYAFELHLNKSGQLRWHSGNRYWTSEPEAGRLRRLKAWLIDWLPIEGQM